jgi:hypothetical protein
MPEICSFVPAKFEFSTTLSMDMSSIDIVNAKTDPGRSVSADLLAFSRRKLTASLLTALGPA